MKEVKFDEQVLVEANNEKQNNAEIEVSDAVVTAVIFWR